jgi:hypothetical protein
MKKPVKIWLALAGTLSALLALQVARPGVALAHRSGWTQGFRSQCEVSYTSQPTGAVSNASDTAGNVACCIPNPAGGNNCPARSSAPLPGGACGAVPGGAPGWVFEYGSWGGRLVGSVGGNATQGVCPNGSLDGTGTRIALPSTPLCLGGVCLKLTSTK